MLLFRWAGRRTGVIFGFRLITSLLLPIDTKLAVYVAYIKRQFVIATQASVVKVTVTVTKKDI